jgi:beta-xylosidase
MNTTARTAGRTMLVPLAAWTLAGTVAVGDENDSNPSGSTPTAVQRVYAENFPDPHVIADGDMFYAYATNGEAGNLPVIRSTDLRTWEAAGDAMPELASWVFAGRTWAPGVIAIDDSFIAYYTASQLGTGLQCVGRAVADDPAGPFVDDSDSPLVCQDDEGGSIDASPFRASDGSLYLYWKNDGNCCGFDTWLYGQPLTDDGLSLIGEPVRLLKQDADWEGDLVEAPFMWSHDDRLYLFYSANAFDSADYAVGYATCDAPLGPCDKAAENPILRTSAVAEGPGHNSVVEFDGRTWLAYHAWPPDFFASSDVRSMWVSELTWQDGRPVVDGPR